MQANDTTTTDVPRLNQDDDNRPNPIDFEVLIQEGCKDDDEDSHTEFDPKVFHPSNVGYHPWLMLVNKLGLSDKSGLAGTFQMGTLIHEFVQRQFYAHGNDSIHIEKSVEFEEDGLVFTGRADLYDNNVVYDLKSRNGWYNFSPPVERHVDQLHCYMRGLDADYGQLIYLSKKDMEVRTWPEGAPFTFDENRWTAIKERCTRVRDALYEEGIPQSEDEIPFDKPDDDHDQSYFVESTNLDFSAVNGGNEGGDNS